MPKHRTRGTDSTSDRERLRIAARLKQARVAAGFRTAQQFALTYNVPQPTYANQETGARGLRRDVAKRYSDWLNVSVAWLLTGEGAGPVPRIKLMGVVGAGEQILPIDDLPDPDAWIDAPPHSEGCGAYRIRGDSMEPAYRDGDIVVVRQHVPDLAAAIGHDCAVQVHNGPLYFKRVIKGSGPSTFHLASYNRPDIITDQRLDWVALVEWIRRGG